MTYGSLRRGVVLAAVLLSIHASRAVTAETEPPFIVLGRGSIDIDESPAPVTNGGYLLGGNSRGVTLTATSGDIRLSTPAPWGQFRQSDQVLTAHDQVQMADFDHDGDLDVAVVDVLASLGPVEILLNDGTGRFETFGEIHDRAALRSVADLDADGIPDLVLRTLKEHLVFLNDGTGRLVAPDQSLAIPCTRDMVVTDIDGDLDLDLVSQGSASVCIWLNDGRGRFTDSGVQLPLGESRPFIDAADFDGDGDIDLVSAVAGFGFTEELLIMENHGDLEFTLLSRIPLSEGDTLQTLAVGDMNDDGAPDLVITVVVSNYGDSPAIWLNEGVGSFKTNGQLFSQGQVPTGAALGDLDGDGDTDSWVVGGADPSLVSFNNGDGVLAQNALRLGNNNGRGVALGDLNGDGALDAYVANGIGDQVWLNEPPTLPIRTWSWLDNRDDGPRSSKVVTLTARSANGAARSITFNFSVLNAPPHVSTVAPPVVAAGTPLEVSVAAQDPSEVDQRAGLTYSFFARRGGALELFSEVGPIDTELPVSATAPPDWVADACPGHLDVRFRVQDKDDRLAQRTSRVRVVDRSPPTGGITFPQPGACLGPAHAPVQIATDFSDACTSLAPLVYTPSDPGVGPYPEGDHEVRVEATDLSGFMTAATVAFTIDWTAPVTSLGTRQPRPVPLATSLPLSMRSASNDQDAATGGVLRERLLLDECPLLDSDVDGPLRGALTVTRQMVCDALTDCSIKGSSTHLSYEAIDCGDNVGRSSVSVYVDAPALGCDGPARNSPLYDRE